MDTKTHFTRVRERWHGGTGRTFVARCNCGWESKPQADVGKAEDAGDDHVVYMTTVVEG